MSMRSQRGMSMIEIIGVVLIIGILTAMAKSPMTQYLRSMEQKSAVLGIRKMLQTARSRAMANPSVHFGVHFDMASVPPKAELFQDNFAPGAYAFDTGKDKPYSAPFTMPKGTSLSIPGPYPASIIYRGDGSAFLSAKVVVKSAGLTDTVDVLASTGRIRSTR
jgi:prepilin-type N-terminal cleavage/methylation domain-containing protein